MPTKHNHTGVGNFKDGQARRYADLIPTFALQREHKDCPDAQLD